MLGYRLYLVDAAGHFTGSSEFEAPSDEEAVSLANEHRRGSAAELWERGRRLKLFNGCPTAPVAMFRYAEEDGSGR